MKTKTFWKVMIEIVSAFICVSLMCGCSKKEMEQESDFGAEENPQIPQISTENQEMAAPDISQIRAICELATLECYYHNVAIATKEKGTGIWHWGEKDRQFWIEYSGSARLGIDMWKVSMKAEGTWIEITIPKAELLSLTDYVFEEENYISEDDGINKNPITAENQTEAVSAAQEEVRQRFSGDKVLLSQAQDRAKMLIENYVNQLGDLTGTDYQIIWVYEANDSEGEVLPEDSLLEGAEEQEGGQKF